MELHLRRSGAKASPYDGSDQTWPATESPGHPRVELPLPLPAYRQETVPCCVPAAVCGAMEALLAASGTLVRLDPLFLYYYSRPNPSSLGDTFIRAVLETAATRGVRALPDGAPLVANEDTAKQAPPQVEPMPRQYVIPEDENGDASYYRVGGDVQRSWDTALQSGFPVVFIFWMITSYSKLEKPGTERLDPTNLQVSSRQHAALVYGCDHEDYLVRDSRGPNFGNRGSWRLPRALAHSLMHAESWVIQRSGLFTPPLA